MRKLTICSSLLLLGILVSSASADFEAGSAAFFRRDYATALKELFPLAQQGHANAQHLLGLMYQFGWGVSTSGEEAFKWYRRAAEGGSSQAQYRLGRAYSDQTGFYGVSDSRTEALKWYRTAALAGNAQAQQELGRIFHQGEGVIQDYSEALKWYRMAAEQGDGESQYQLGIMYRRGVVVPQDYVQAFIWLYAAFTNSDLGSRRVLSKLNGRNEDTKEQLASLIRVMNPEQLRRARELTGARDDRLPTAIPPETKKHPDLSEFDRIAREGENESKAKKTARDNGEDDPFAEYDLLLITEDYERVTTGTGFVVSTEGHVLTNYHVVEGCSGLIGRGSSKTRSLKLLAKDEANDLALIGFFKASSPLAFSATETLQLGQGVVAVGYPLQGLLASSLNLTAGNISALAGVRDDERMIQISAPIQAGNSGGPIFDEGGNVVGVIASKLNVLKTQELLGDFPQNVNFAIRGSLASTFLRSSAVEYVTVSSVKRMDTTQIAERARKAVLVVECWK